MLEGICRQHPVGGPGPDAVQPAYRQLENVQEIQTDHNADLKVVLQPYLRSSVRIRESHEQSMPMIFLDPSHTLTQEFVALHDALA